MSSIQIDVEQGVATITLDAPETRNALNAALSQQLVDACERIDADTQIGAAVVRGAGGTFCSGAERGLLERSGEDPAEAERYAEIGAAARRSRASGPRTWAWRGRRWRRPRSTAGRSSWRGCRRRTLSWPGVSVSSMRRELGPPAVSWPVALDLERGSQMWSLRRRNTCPAS